MKHIILFFMIFIVIYLYYFIFVINKINTSNQKNKLKKIPIEVKYVIKRYKLDIKEINIKKLINIICIATSFSMSIAISFISIINNIYIQIIVGLLIVMSFSLVCYDIIGKKFKKEND